MEQYGSTFDLMIDIEVSRSCESLMCIVCYKYICETNLNHK